MYKEMFWVFINLELFEIEEIYWAFFNKIIYIEL